MLNDPLWDTKFSLSRRKKSFKIGMDITSLDPLTLWIADIVIVVSEVFERKS